ncbi:MULTISPECIES: PstS family phosphate ABC transporter substrate-binding protein [Ignavibacterium]|jgi:phosphate transport system substrate-binding protein|uniref:PstS family phosphate ABC transporter substrate-binding protein n=1 Tax=Ignavibacterium TaxID=795750 RepID=UPI0025C385C2|nr:MULTISPECIES: substrate-binding domain-containing protein [Ignavibacterium]MBI5662151.1 substrate-binding domain-containing protein [Ignavibacterium album]
MTLNKSGVFLVAVIIILFGCDRNNSPSDTPTSGDLTISVDQTFKPLIDSEVSTFESIYKYADVKVQYKSENEAFDDLMNDSIRVIIVSRKLNSEEIKQFQKWEIVPRVTKIAYDAIALIGSKDLKDTVFTIDELKSLLSGEKIVPSLNKTKIIFDSNNSSTMRLLSEKAGVKNFSKNCFALNSTQAVLDYISKGSNCIGIIGVNWISDQDDSSNQNFLKSIKVLEISSNENSEPLKPYQAYIAQKTYPLYREVYIISKEAYNGLGTGFTAFVSSERGQRIVLKFGLVPATMPIRLVEIVNEDLNN